MSDAGLDAYKLSFQISPIILTGGMAQLIPGFGLPIISITEALNFTVGLLSGGDDISLDNFFAHFSVVSGGSLIDWSVGTYAFANQATAANAMIKNPNRISLKMACPLRGPLAMATKLATMTALQAALEAHNNSGGTYTVATPAYIYTDCLLVGLRDVSSGPQDQPQTAFVWDFVQPLVTELAAFQTMGGMLSKVAGGLPTNGAWSGIGSTIGSPLSLAAPGIIPAASNLSGANVAGFTGFGQ